MRGRPIPYSAKELAWIKAHSRDVRVVAHATFCARFERSDVTLICFNALCKRRGWMTGRTGRLEAGNVPYNKGKPHPSRGRASETQFKQGALPHNTNYLGHERVSKDGYVEISVAETNPHTGFERRYVLKHKHLWEQINGPLPEGMCLKCVDGNRGNPEAANWEAIPRAALPYLNGRWNGLNYDQAAPELRPAILAVAKLKYAARSKENTQDDGIKAAAAEPNNCRSEQ